MENLQNDDDEIATFCADGEVIWKSEIEAIMAGKPIEKKQEIKNPKDDTVDKSEK